MVLSLEGTLKERIVSQGYTRQVTCMRFVKVRAHGGLESTRCLKKADWAAKCSPESVLPQPLHGPEKARPCSRSPTPTASIQHDMADASSAVVGPADRAKPVAPLSFASLPGPIPEAECA